MASDEEGIEFTILRAMDDAAIKSEKPVRKAVHDAQLAKYIAIISIAGLVLSLLALIGVAKALHDSKKVETEFRNGICARGNDFRAEDLKRWNFFIDLITERDEALAPRPKAQKKREEVKIATFRKFLLEMDAPVDCAAFVYSK